MRRITLLAVLFGTVMSAASQASEFDGHYVGLNVGKNRASQTSMPDNTSTYLGVKAGYNLDLGNFLLGAEAFANNHTKSYTGRDAGGDVRLGLPMNQWLPYVKLGMVGTTPGFRAHGALGVEFKLSSHWSINVEWATDSRKDADITRKNNNIAIGLNFLLDPKSGATTSPVAAGSASVADGSTAARAAALERAAAAERVAAAAAERAVAAERSAEAAAARAAEAERAAASERMLATDTAPAKSVHKVFLGGGASQ